MAKFLLYCLLLVAFTSCNRKKIVHIYIENGSATQQVIPMAIYRNDTLWKTVHVKKGKEVFLSKYVPLTLAPGTRQLNLRFEIPGTAYRTTCTLHAQDLRQKDIALHVSLHEMMFRKGYDYEGRTLDKDTLVEAGLYAGLFDAKMLCGFIDNSEN